ncbi:DUF1501 domain-containing protein [Nocardioides sp. R-C-SC26]|uniref:DUF1501 domain-containing protein n=1 Tax=Nocardioides sp. R-C-SC26 TaxID=2870414 RepID=UPI001E2C1C92|nr:DUF1501 domain-containing protein [Nocardioides sp. R-C-SC26]
MTDTTSSGSLSPVDACGCDDYRGLSRRGLLAGAGAAGLAGVTTSMVGDVMTAAVYGAPAGPGANAGNVLVVVSQRGGVDGLSMVVPHAEATYYRERPTTALRKRQLLHADSTFGLHPSFAPLSRMWRNDAFAAIHAVGMPIPNRSHFSAMEEIEDADPGSRERIGWLNRMIGAFATEDVFRGVAVGTNVVPTSLVGPSDAVAIASPSHLETPFAGTPSGTALRRGLRAMYEGGNHPVKQAGMNALSLAHRGLQYSESAAKTPRNGAKYPDSGLGRSLRDAAALIRSGVGVRAIAVDSGGWDHHLALTSSMNQGVSDLASSLAAFFTDLGPVGKRVTVVTLSEFGRRLNENGAAGVDHGYGNAVLVLGAGVRGGRYYGRWPGLGTTKQVEGDLAVTTDYRNVMAEILQTRFPSIDTSAVFPGVTYDRVGFMRRA